MIIIQAITLLIETVCSFLANMGVALIDCIPVFYGLRQSLSHCTFSEAWGLFLGVSPVLITVICKLAHMVRKV